MIGGLDRLHRVLECYAWILEARTAQRPGFSLAVIGELDAATELHRLIFHPTLGEMEPSSF